MKPWHSLCPVLRLRAEYFTLLLVLLALFSSCHRNQDLTGKYNAAPSTEEAPLVMVLKSNGKGSWTVGRESVTFSWESGNNEVLLHTKAGGVIVGKVGADGSILVDLPGVGGLHFQKVKE